MTILINSLCLIKKRFLLIITSLSMSKKLAIITGGCSGLGYATAKLLVKQNYFVVMSDLFDNEGSQ